jgi:hypothetical protein
VGDHSYVARFGWTPRDLLLLPFSLFCAVLGAALAVTGVPLWGALTGLIGAVYLVMWTISWLSRRVALAVTAAGITLGFAPVWPASRTAFVPWSDIEAIVWRQTIGYTSFLFIGVQRRAGAPPLPGSARNRLLRRINKALAPAHLPEALVADSRPVNFWRLDKTRLTTAVNHLAPRVQIVDQT